MLPFLSFQSILYSDFFSPKCKILHSKKTFSECNLTFWIRCRKQYGGIRSNCPCKRCKSCGKFGDYPVERCLKHMDWAYNFGDIIRPQASRMVKRVRNVTNLGCFILLSNLSSCQLLQYP